MAVKTIQIKRGLKVNLPAEALAGELIYSMDEGELYIGQGPSKPIKRFGDVEAIVATKSALPSMGREGKLYIVLADESIIGNGATIYLYRTAAYKLIGGSGVSGDVIIQALGFTPEDSAKKDQPEGYAGLDADGKIAVSQLPDSLKEVKVVNDIAARDALTPVSGMRVHVIDATGDSTVNLGWAEYLYTGSEWTKVAEKESIDVVLAWANIQNKPTSSVTNIDDAVAKRHAHSNAAILDATTASFTVELREQILDIGNIDGGTF